MTVERALRLIAGTFILATLALSLYSHAWLWMTAFIGLNLLQSGFTDWCPMVWILQKAGLRRCAPSPAAAAPVEARTGA
jgi:hypothetical protein